MGAVPESDARLAFLALQGRRLYFAEMLKPSKRNDVVCSERNFKPIFFFILIVCHQVAALKKRVRHCISKKVPTPSM